MTINITDADVFEDPVVAPATGDDANQATFLAGLQDLANRTRYLYNRLGTVPTLAANRILARASTGATEGKPSTDFTLSMVALGTAVAWHDALSTKGNNLASAATTNLAAATGQFVHVTGTTTITSFGTATAGVRRVVTFDATLTLEYSANLITQSGRDQIVDAGDSIEVVSEGGGVWRVVATLPYQKYLLGHANESTFFGAAAGNLAGMSDVADANAAFGFAALGSLVDGQSNSAFGHDAGSGLTTGTHNIFLGIASGDNLVDGDGNIFIGDGVQAPATDTDDYLTIGDVLFGDLDGIAVRVGGSGVVDDTLGRLQVHDGDIAFVSAGGTQTIYIDGKDGYDLEILAQDGGGALLLGRSDGDLGFFGASGVPKQTVSGSTIDGTALQDLLDALVAYGLIFDVTNDS